MAEEFDNIRYVSVMYELYENQSDLDFRFMHMKLLFNMNIKLIVLVEPKLMYQLETIVDELNATNIQLISFPKENLETYNYIINLKNITMPESDNMQKDTLKFHALMNSKTEILNIVCDKNKLNLIPEHIKYVIWIDLSLTKVLNDMDLAKFRLNYEIQKN